MDYVCLLKEVLCLSVYYLSLYFNRTNQIQYALTHVKNTEYALCVLLLFYSFILLFYYPGPKRE